MNGNNGYLKLFSRLVLSGLVSFFAIGFLKNFYPYTWQLVLLTVALNLFCALASDLIIEHAIHSLKDQWREKIILLLTLLLGLVFIILTAHLLIQYPKIFSTQFFLPEASFIPWLLGVTVLSQVGAVFILQKLEQRGWQTSPLAERIKRNLPGLLLAIAVTLATFALSTAFTYPGFNNTDNYFDTDSMDWINRLTADVQRLDGNAPCPSLRLSRLSSADMGIIHSLEWKQVLRRAFAQCHAWGSLYFSNVALLPGTYKEFDLCLINRGVTGIVQFAFDHERIP